MSFGMIGTEVEHRMREVRRQAAQGRVPHPARPAPAAGSSPAHAPAVARPPEAVARPQAVAVLTYQRRRPGLRSRIGFTLVETGLRLLTSGQQAQG